MEYDIQAELARFDEYRETLRKYVVDGVSFMRTAQESDMKIVIEGANVRLSSYDYATRTDYWGNEHRAHGLTALFPSPRRILSLRRNVLLI